MSDIFNQENIENHENDGNLGNGQINQNLFSESNQGDVKVNDNLNEEESVVDKLNQEIEKLNHKLVNVKRKNFILFFLIIIIIISIALGIYYVFTQFIPYYRIARNKTKIDNLSIVSTDSEALSIEGGIDLMKFAEKFQIIDDYINLYYYYDKDNEKILDEMFKGYVKGLGDKYAEYMPATNYENFVSEQSGEYYGIGAAVTQDADTKESKVTEVYENSPAEKAGVKVDDIFKTVNGVDVSKYELTDIVSLIKGKEGTTVDIGLYRASEDKIVNLTCTRGKVEIKLVHYEVKEKDIGYLRYSEFSGKGYAQFVSAINDLQKKKVKGLIIDLRNNPGGELSIVLNMLDYILRDNDGKFTLNQKENNFVPGKTLLVYMKDKTEIIDQYYCQDKHQVNLPIVILTNGASASASELFTEALRDYGKAKVVGEKTYGKGVMQNLIPLEDGSAIKFTVAGYFPPSGYEIDKNGIKPDYALEYDGTPVTYDENGNEIFEDENGNAIILEKDNNMTPLIKSSTSTASEIKVNKNENSDTLNITDTNFKFVNEDWYIKMEKEYEDKQLLQAIVLLK